MFKKILGVVTAMALTGIMMFSLVFADAESDGSAKGADDEAETGGVIKVNTPTSNCYFEECTFINNKADIASGSEIGH
ncbi:MAG: hypothetical protein K5649_10530 [Lachnospiraceae bacterium]|nr:hypothetical protein [Lachnospiraceae bacterium]